MDNFTISKCFIDGVYIIEPKRYFDDRGYFTELYEKKVFDKLGIKEFVQDNESKSIKGVLRGIHFQKIHPQAKLVRCSYGEVFDVCVDLRKDSKTYGKYFSIILSSGKGNMMYIPKGFGHGFLVLSDEAVFNYKCDEYYYPDDEDGIRWDSLGIDWPHVNELIISEKDREYKEFKQ